MICRRGPALVSRTGGSLVGAGTGLLSGGAEDKVADFFARSIPECPTPPPHRGRMERLWTGIAPLDDNGGGRGGGAGTRIYEEEEGRGGGGVCGGIQRCSLSWLEVA